MDVMLVFDAVVALFGAYMIGSALHMKKSGRINSMVLAQEELKKVKDTKGFIEFLYWRDADWKSKYPGSDHFSCSFHLVSEFIGESEREVFTFII